MDTIESYHGNTVELSNQGFIIRQLMGCEAINIIYPTNQLAKLIDVQKQVIGYQGDFTSHYSFEIVAIDLETLHTELMGIYQGNKQIQVKLVK